MKMDSMTEGRSWEEQPSKKSSGHSSMGLVYSGSDTEDCQDLILTYWEDTNGSRKNESFVSWDQFFHWIKTLPPQVEKEKSPLIKFAKFGSTPTKKGCLRYNANVEYCSGWEADLDNGQLKFDEVLKRLEDNNIRCLVATSFSHTPHFHKLRIFGPFKDKCDPYDRRRFLGRINGLLGGNVASESFVVSQSYFIGGKVGGEYRVEHTFDDPEEGFCIDDPYLEGLDAQAIYPQLKEVNADDLDIDPVPDDEKEFRFTTALDDPNLQYIFSGEAKENDLGQGKKYPSASEMDYALASLCFKHLGPDPVAIEELMRKSSIVREKWNRHEYLKKTILSIIASSQQQEKPEAPVDEGAWDTPIDLLSLLDVEPAPITWFIQDRILAGRGGLVSGVGGSSKTRLLYHLAAGTALGGLPWDWTPAMVGRSVLVLTEDTADDLHRTIHSLCLSLNLSLEQKQTLYKSIIPFPLAGRDVRLLMKSRNQTLVKSPLFNSLVNKIKSFGDVAFVGLDPALGLTEGDEMDQGNQRLLGKMADDLGVQTGAATMLVTHATKGSLSSEELSSHNSRGGGAITDAVRTEFVMRTMTSKEAKKAKIKDKEERFRHVQLVGTKGNYLPPDAYVPVWLRRDNYGMLNKADVNLEEYSGPGKKEAEALGVLKELCKSHVPSLAEWRQACVEEEIIGSNQTEKGQAQSMYRIRSILSDENLIKKGHGRGIWVPCDPEEEMLDFTDLNGKP
ncbi:MAG: AAA family ATPase [Desulfonatronovibrio sp.]|nr:helicase RepA family protein [Desulfovibrionales bacterium]